MTDENPDIKNQVEKPQVNDQLLNGDAVGTKSGFVALVGRPNVGKSSFLNKLLRQKIAIVSPRVQTTRTKIMGVYTNKQTQVVFVDLPGIHKPVDELGKTCLQISLDGAAEADLIIFMSEANRLPGEGDRWISSWIKQHKAHVRTFLVLNKSDLAKDKKRLKKDILAYEELFEGMKIPVQTFELSTQTGEGLDELCKVIESVMPFGPFYFPEDSLTNRSYRFMASELIREQILFQTEDEIPHSCAVRILEYLEPKDLPKQKKELLKIKALVLVETESQKSILIGKNASRIKEIGSKARLQIEELVGSKVFLDLKVKVSPKWRKDLRTLNTLELVDSND
jgi:GTPase